VRQTVKPAIAEGAEGAGRDPAQVTLATSVFVIVTGDAAAEQRESVREQISFYASTPTYRTVLEAHGWEEVGERLGVMAREKQWREMPALITDEMISAFAIEAHPDEIGPALRERYEDLVARAALYLPFGPGERDEFWRTVVDSARV
jgi:alkanesulfonate monooxygenase SsuD/methylene tetrahydromethanopterin reductase-like flavin-dependent oxidoreductase (luciferase family)